jgi:hypothetical protein
MRWLEKVRDEVFWSWSEKAAKNMIGQSATSCSDLESRSAYSSNIQLRRDELGPDDAAERENAREEHAAAISRGNRDLDAGREGTRTPKSKSAETMPASPLNKLFSRPAATVAPMNEAPTSGQRHHTRSNDAGDDLVRTHAEEFDELRRQLEAMKEGQAKLTSVVNATTRNTRSEVWIPYSLEFSHINRYSSY